MKRRMGSEWIFEYHGVTLRAEHVSALILKKLLQDAQLLAGDVTQAAVTVPAYFNDTMRAATRYAAEIAGVQVLGLLSEPTAAAIAFGYDHRPDELQGIVVDLGGGTFDVTVLEFDHQDLIVKGTGGDAYLGGANFDKILFDHFVLSSTDSTGSTCVTPMPCRLRTSLRSPKTGCCEPIERSMISAPVIGPSSSCRRPDSPPVWKCPGRNLRR